MSMSCPDPPHVECASPSAQAGVGRTGLLPWPFPSMVAASLQISWAFRPLPGVVVHDDDDQRQNKRDTHENRNLDRSHSCPPSTPDVSESVPPGRTTHIRWALNPRTSHQQ